MGILANLPAGLQPDVSYYMLVGIKFIRSACWHFRHCGEPWSGCVAKRARIKVAICRIKAWRMTAFPTTGLVPNPAVFCSCLRNLDGTSDLSFSPEITLLTLSGVVKPLRSIKMPFEFSYLGLRKGWSNTSPTSDATSPESSAQVNL